ncbi:NAD(P)-dependent oxidoreductase [Bradyrhizobium ganzhouense]|uniref:NAD(P)-dependent oxidoreductase n=1 Tax=Bradyrhizobium ganzhouense TaxID=1179767 RepID=UPI003CF19BF7
MYHPLGRTLLEEAGAEVVVVDSSDVAELKQSLRDALVLWVRAPEKVTVDVLDAGEHLIAVSSSGFGTDNIDIAAASARGILVVNHHGFGRVPVSEHAILLILASMKRLVWGDQGVRDGTAWAVRSNLSLEELGGSTVGVVGIGFVGSEVARKLRSGFGCRVIGYDPYADPRLTSLAGVEMVPDLCDLLTKCDVLVLTPSLTDETRNMIGAAELAKLPKGAVVINVGRGRVLDLDALASALDRGHVFAAGLDVFYPEPLPINHPLLSSDKVTFSPHVAGNTTNATEGLSRSAAEQISACLRGEMPRFAVNPEAWTGSISRRPMISA